MKINSTYRAICSHYILQKSAAKFHQVQDEQGWWKNKFK